MGTHDGQAVVMGVGSNDGAPPTVGMSVGTYDGTAVGMGVGVKTGALVG